MPFFLRGLLLWFLGSSPGYPSFSFIIMTRLFQQTDIHVASSQASRWVLPPGGVLTGWRLFLHSAAAAGFWGDVLLRSGRLSTLDSRRFRVFFFCRSQLLKPKTRHGATAYIIFATPPYTRTSMPTTAILRPPSRQLGSSTVLALPHVCVRRGARTCHLR